MTESEHPPYLNMPAPSNVDPPNTIPVRHRRPARRRWYRDFFIDHPGFETRDPNAFAGRGVRPDKVKVFCRNCLEQQIIDIEWEEREELEEGLRQPEDVRSRESILDERE